MALFKYNVRLETVLRIICMVVYLATFSAAVLAVSGFLSV
jgi:hypothetical protein